MSTGNIVVVQPAPTRLIPGTGRAKAQAQHEARAAALRRAGKGRRDGPYDPDDPADELGDDPNRPPAVPPPLK